MTARLVVRNVTDVRAESDPARSTGTSVDPTTAKSLAKASSGVGGESMRLNEALRTGRGINDAEDDEVKLVADEAM